jgi:carbamoyltransferase
MRILGISGMFHDASATMIEDGKILFAGHAERYSREKNDAYINKQLMKEACATGLPDVIVLHESSKLKQQRRYGQMTWGTVLSTVKSAFTEPTMEDWLSKFYPQFEGIPVTNCLHHQSHAAAGMLTVPHDWRDAVIVTIDAIGEKQTATISTWEKNQRILLRHEVNFPNSLGLFYSAVTSAIGLKPMEDEYILMGMAAYGKPIYKTKMETHLFNYPIDDLHKCLETIDMSKGLPESFFEDIDVDHEQTQFDLAASAQAVVEERIIAYCRLAFKYSGGSRNLVYMGGVALNCVANSLIYKEDVFKNIWIMPNPGDAGSSLGAAALYYYENTAQFVQWEGPYLGTEIEGKWPKEKFLESLHKGDIFGVANGKAEFGPRAFGNRSLFADARGTKIKDKVNKIKRRQEFRPFAPIVLEEHAKEWFDMPGGISQSPYMSFVAKCLKPDEIPAVVHADGTSRVQTVNRDQHPELYHAMRQWYAETGCPVVLNTSLNIKGQPIVNTEDEAQEFAKHYKVKVHCRDDY